MSTISIDYIERIIADNLPQGDDVVCQAARYAVIGGGKRFRPSLLLNAALACGGVTTNAEKLACALEFVHNYSLIHDDLPCMDNDDFRRGRPTVHKKYGEAVAVLAGDLLLNLAAEVAFSGDFSERNYSSACQILFEHSGSRGMIHGQCLDLFVPTVRENDAIEVAVCKTADLLRAALVCGSICGGADTNHLDTIDRLATSLGICYQLADDLSDASKNEKSFLSVLSTADCLQLFDTHLQIVTECVQSLPYDFGFVFRVTEWLSDSVMPIRG